MENSNTQIHEENNMEIRGDSKRIHIPAKPKITLTGNDSHFRVCAYCRVSTDNDEQLSSFELQQEHYQQVVKDRPNWELKHIYADEGISGTSLKNRDQFNEMLQACYNGEYDLIVTKSVSRFARNLVDCISIVRKLKTLTPPVGVYFETDNLYTLAEGSELMLSFIATIAQEESVKKSEAMNWSLNQRFRDEKLLTPALLGYDRKRDAVGNYIKYAPLEINESEAKIVRFIYDAYLIGWSTQEIANLLEDLGCKTKTGATKWSQGTITYILSNERYCGDVLTWKTFTSDLYEHKHKRNHMDREQYLYVDKHPAIISKETFEAVQVIKENRKHHGGLPLMQVIDDGLFRGFVPINHHWVNDDPNVYYDISNTINGTNKKRQISKKSLSEFDFAGYQVVRNQFTQSRYEGPSISICDGKIWFNTMCMRRFEDIGYVQLLLHPTERKIAIRPCEKRDVHSISWRPDSDKPIVCKSISCQHFGTALYNIMEWNPEYAYKIRGTYMQRDDERIVIFNLENAVPATFVHGIDSTISKRRKEMCPKEWDSDFGLEFYNHAINNGFFYLVSNARWQTQAKCIPAPGIKPKYIIPPTDELQNRIDCFMKGQI